MNTWPKEDSDRPLVVRETPATYGSKARGLVRGPSFRTAQQTIGALKAGLPMEELEELRRWLDVPMDRLAPVLGLSKATLHRRKLAGRLDAQESDRILRLARLMRLATDVLEAEENARRWLLAPQRGLGGVVPLDFADTELGAREVEDLLHRIDFGVYA
jgi:putative toxin-antitoxin system antitoxin component (TIGR02293 family)